MKKIPPQRLSNKAWIETHDDVILIDVNPLDMSTDISEPDPELSENIQCVWRNVKQKSLSSEMLQVLLEATKDYLINAQFDNPERNASPGHIRDYVSKVEKTVAALQALLNPNHQDKRQATIIRQLTAKGKSAIAMHDLAEAAEAFRQTAIELGDKMDEGKRGDDGTKVRHARMVSFAAKLIKIFEEHDLPMGFGPDDLLAQVLGVCLEAAGDPHQNPDRLLAVVERSPNTD